MLLSDSLMTNYQIVLGGFLVAACSSSSIRANGDPNASGGRGSAMGGVLGTGGSGTGGVLNTGGSGTGGVLGTSGSGGGGVLGTAGSGRGGVISGAGGCDQAACVNGRFAIVGCDSTESYVNCDKARAGVECVSSGHCPVLDAGRIDGLADACDNRCAIGELCVAYFDGDCQPAGTACRQVSSSCKETVIGPDATCPGAPCDDEICGLKDNPNSYRACNYAYCASDPRRADATCHAVGDVGGD